MSTIVSMFDVRKGRKSLEVQWVFFETWKVFATIRVWRKKLKREV
jgi:hypothetical protein